MSFDELPLSLQILLGGTVPLAVCLFLGNIVAASAVGAIMALVPLYWLVRSLMYLVRAATTKAGEQNK